MYDADVEDREPEKEITGTIDERIKQKSQHWNPVLDQEEKTRLQDMLIDRVTVRIMHMHDADLIDMAEDECLII